INDSFKFSKKNLIIILDIILAVCVIVSTYAWINSKRRLNRPLSIMRLENLHNLVYASDVNCVSQLRMDRQIFYRLCHILSTRRKLRKTQNVFIEEMVAMFLYMNSSFNRDQRGRDSVLIEYLLELSQNLTWRANSEFKNGYLQ
ncbi:hypothetical protein G4B88_028294, partial [Cannabis sativa]